MLRHLPLLLVVSFAHAQELNVRDFGAKGDGKTDDAVAFQEAIDEAAAARGLTVYAPPGNYVFKSSLNVPASVCLRGSWQSVPAHNGLRDKGMPKPTDDGTTFLVETGEGKEEGAFVTLNTNSTLKGVVIFYPNQNRDKAPVPYPYAIAMRGKNPAVLDVELLNPYNGIDASQNERHLIRDVDGQPLRRGLFVDAIYDIGRIENVHFNPWWSVEPALLNWQQEHGEAFIVGRSDWQYMTNTFCFGYNIGYHFVETKNGICNGNFLGLGADDCYTAVQVDQCAPFGLLITNGEFVSFHGPDPTMVHIAATNTGSVRFSNCAFWGPCNQIARIEGKGTVGFSDCTFVQWKKAAIEALGGTVLLRGCEFRGDGMGMHAGAGAAVVISDCVGPGSGRIAADPGSHVKGPN